MNKTNQVLKLEIQSGIKKGPKLREIWRWNLKKLEHELQRQALTIEHKKMQKKILGLEDMIEEWMALSRKMKSKNFSGQNIQKIWDTKKRQN